MEIQIDRTSRVPIYRQIVDTIRGMIVSGALPPGFRLPPERRLAESLGVNRTTVLSAYRELKGDGLIDAHVGRGTIVVQPPGPPVESAPAARLPWRQLMRESAGRRRDPVIRDLLEMAGRTDVISLSAGLPARELVPMETLSSILDDLVSELGSELVMQGPTEGIGAFRETLGHWLAGRGISCSPSEVLALSGSQQGLDLVARVLVDPGDVVVVEEPTYIGALEVFRAAQARVISIPCDRDGMDTGTLAGVLERHRPKLIYTLPTFQNPSGSVLPVERRRHMLELASRHQVPILEDDPYAELRFEGEPLPSLKALDREGNVLYLSTFSKLLFPGLRVGFMVAPRAVTGQLVVAKQAVDLHSSTLGQHVVERFVRDGHMNAHIVRARQTYLNKRDAMHEALVEAEVPGLEWHPPPGGFYMWCRLPETVERATLLARAADRGVAFLPGWACCADDPADTPVRLNFSHPSESEIREGVARFAAAIGESRSARPAAPAGSGTPAIV